MEIDTIIVTISLVLGIFSLVISLIFWKINRRRSALADPGGRPGEKNNPGNPD